jgi:tRNA A-37 threonylcarbamoyl transferase component Bud32
MTQLDLAIPGLFHRFFTCFRKIEANEGFLKSMDTNWTDEIFEYELTDRLFVKQGRSIVRWTVDEADPESLVVFLKRHYKNSRWKGFLATLFPSNAWTASTEEAGNLKIANSLGIRIPVIAAVGEYIDPGFQLRGFIAIEELKGMLALHEAIPLAFTNLNADDFRSWKDGLIKEVARITECLHRHQYFHRDLYLCHFFILESDCSIVPHSWHQQVTTIDFHRLKKQKWTAFRARIKDLAQLLYSTMDVPGIDESDRTKFRQAYEAIAGTSSTSFWNAVRRKADRYWQHNQKAINPKVSP